MSNLTILVNGEKTTLPGDGLRLSTVLAAAGVTNLEAVSVQLNGEYADPATFATSPLKDGDEVEFLYFLGGGQD